MKGLKETRVIHYIIGLIIYLTIFSVSILNVSFVFAEEEQKQNAQDERITRLAMAIDVFKAGNDEQAKTLFIASKAELPENPIPCYYLALIYTKQDNLKDAITEWKGYLKIDPKSETSNEVRQFLTVLIKEDAKRFAASSVKEEGQLSSVKTDENTVAVTYFHNVGSEGINPLSKGLAAMLITDISQVKELKVVEREKIQALYTEMKLSETGLVQESTIPKMGKLIKARNITTGSYVDPTSEELQITSAVFGSDDNKEKGINESKGKIANFFDLEKEVAKAILATLKIDWNTVPEEAKKIHTKNYEAFVDYSNGIDYMDKEQYDKAKESLKKAVELDPNFKLAKEAYLSIPLAALSVAAVIASAVSAAPVVTTAVVVGVTAISAGTAIAVGTTATAVGVGTVVAGTTTGGCSSSKGSWGGSYNVTACNGKTANNSWVGTVDGNCNFSVVFTVDNKTASFKGIVSGSNVTADADSPCGTVYLRATVSGSTMRDGSVYGGVTGTWGGSRK
ncbi:MAG: hypothetical protein HQK91_04570 [Nitrospirae bacterium]|nr:hypothetical protein [Nitrospirota bacterium]